MKKLNIFYLMLFNVVILSSSFSILCMRLKAPDGYAGYVKDIEEEKIGYGCVNYTLSSKDITAVLLTKQDKEVHLFAYIWPDFKNDIRGDNIRVFYNDENEKAEKMKKILLHYLKNK